MNELGIFVENERAVVSSRDVARVFEKGHRHVLRDIAELECSGEFRESNFGRGSYIDANNQERPQYLITRDGFTLLAMGYTGKKAMQFKEAYIAAFNRMEEELRKKRAEAMPPRDYAAALRAYADEVERRELAEKLRDYAIRTKAEIGERREATAMNTASQAVKQCNKLKDEIGNSKTWKRTKAIKWLTKYFAPSIGMWSAVGIRLKKLSGEMGYKIRKAEDSEYGAVNVYHIDVIDMFHSKVKADPNMLRKYRKEA